MILSCIIVMGEFPLSHSLSPTYVRPKALILAEAKKSPIKDVLNYVPELHIIVYSIFSQV